MKLSRFETIDSKRFIHTQLVLPSRMKGILVLPMEAAIQRVKKKLRVDNIVAIIAISTSSIILIEIHFPTIRLRFDRIETLAQSGTAILGWAYGFIRK